MTTRNQNQQDSVALRNRVLEARKLGVPAAKVAADRGVSASTVYRLVKIYGKNDDSADRSQSSRPRQLSDKQKRAILRTTEEKRIITIFRLLKMIRLKCHPQLVVEYLISNGYKVTPAKNPESFALYTKWDQ